MLNAHFSLSVDTIKILSSPRTNEIFASLKKIWNQICFCRSWWWENVRKNFIPLLLCHDVYRVWSFSLYLDIQQIVFFGNDRHSKLRLFMPKKLNYVGQTKINLIYFLLLKFNKYRTFWKCAGTRSFINDNFLVQNYY